MPMPVSVARNTQSTSSETRRRSSNGPTRSNASRRTTIDIGCTWPRCSQAGAQRIHSGRDRAASRAVCKAYFEGELDFLFIAPERLKVPGFPEMLARRKPTLVAIDDWDYNWQEAYWFKQPITVKPGA